MLRSDDDDEKAKRVKSLEEMVKLGQMQLSTFEALRDEIVGGDVQNVHLVKGLDRRLLERVRRGEDVLSSTVVAETTAAESSNLDKAEDPPAGADMDKELDEVEGKEIQPVFKQEKLKQGYLAQPQGVGKKRNRDDILKELRASRLATATSVTQAAAPTLGPRFTKVGQRKAVSRIEKDDRGREVLITTDENGKVKRKVKKAITEEPETRTGLLMPDKDSKPLGIDVMIPKSFLEESDQDRDIFEDVGADYDPLEGLEDDEDESDGHESTPDHERLSTKDLVAVAAPPSSDRSRMPPPPLPSKVVAGKRDYFGEVAEKKAGASEAPAYQLTDPTILGALKKASTINPLRTQGSSAASEEASKSARHKEMLEAHDRDADDMDLGFGGSRFGDEDEAEGKKIKLSVWGKEGGKEDRSQEGKTPRKRGPKKRKGDVNSAADVLKVLESRKGEVK